MKTIKLNTGVDMPLEGFGVYQIVPEACEAAVLNALETGYRMIDTAQAYYNEEGLGRAVNASGLPREDIFVVTKRCGFPTRAKKRWPQASTRRVQIFRATTSICSSSISRSATTTARIARCKRRSLQAKSAPSV